MSVKRSKRLKVKRFSSFKFGLVKTHKVFEFFGQTFEFQTVLFTV